jgi:two-component SAPR family response regulator
MFFGNVVDIMVEVDNMNDAVKMAQRLTEETPFIVTCITVLICSKIMKTGEINLNKRLEIYNVLLRRYISY